MSLADQGISLLDGMKSLMELVQTGHQELESLSNGIILTMSPYMHNGRALKLRYATIVKMKSIISQRVSGGCRTEI